MSNHEFGGAIAIGIDKSGNHQPSPAFNVKASYQQEAIQFIVSKYASRKFEVEVRFVEHEGVLYLVIVVPRLGELPVVCRSAIGQGTKPHLRDGTIYVRTLNDSGVPSSAPASWKEIEALFDECFRNREANYADFFSRILRSADPTEVRALLAKAKEVSAHALEGFEGLTSLREYALSRFGKIVAKEKSDVERMGFMDTALVIEGILERQWHNDEQFLSALTVAHPGLTNTLVWKVSRSGNPSLQPYTFEGKYEQVVYIRPSKAFAGFGFADFAICDPAGRFFLRKGFLDDLRKDELQSRGLTFDPVIQLARLAEAFVVGSEYAKALGYKAGTQLRFGIWWTGLTGRNLSSWSNSWYDFF
jgi:hypothetical protein